MPGSVEVSRGATPPSRNRWTPVELRSTEPVGHLHPPCNVHEQEQNHEKHTLDQGNSPSRRRCSHHLHGGRRLLQLRQWVECGLRRRGQGRPRRRDSSPRNRCSTAGEYRSEHSPEQEAGSWQNPRGHRERRSDQHRDHERGQGRRGGTGLEGQGDQHRRHPQGDQAAMSAAIQQKPDGISVSSIERSVIGRQLKEAEAAGIPVSANASTDEQGPDLFDTSIANKSQLDAWGKMVAAYVVSESKGEADIAVFSVPALKVLQRFIESFTANVEKWCPTCKVTEVPQQFGDIGTKTPGSVVSTLQRSPKTDWAIFAVGDVTLGVEAALKGAGLSGKVRIGGLGGSAKNVASIKAGTEDAFTAYPFRAIGFRVVDIFARKFNGDDLAEAQKVPVPTQLITPRTLKRSRSTRAASTSVSPPTPKSSRPCGRPTDLQPVAAIPPHDIHQHHHGDSHGQVRHHTQHPCG
ncbi:sugar ABC transporter substrate-binding protein [Aeromicrobium sp. UC242_57]|uniref:sugar ABC transporter substrate-binding protein n=1 Tax=Aeromicrobium sp. UC242_57 TaxID=3374624 RepID=UPI0037A32705